MLFICLGIANLSFSSTFNYPLPSTKSNFHENHALKYVPQTSFLLLEKGQAFAYLFRNSKSRVLKIDETLLRKLFHWAFM